MWNFPIPESRPPSCGPVPTLGNALLLPALSPHQWVDAAKKYGALSFRPRQTCCGFLVPPEVPPVFLGSSELFCSIFYRALSSRDAVNELFTGPSAINAPLGCESFDCFAISGVRG